MSLMHRASSYSSEELFEIATEITEELSKRYDRKIIVAKLEEKENKSDES